MKKGKNFYPKRIWFGLIAKKRDIKHKDLIYFKNILNILKNNNKF